MESRIEQVRTYIVSPTKLTQVNVSCLEYSATILSREMYMSKQAMHYAFHIDLPNQHYLADNDDYSQYDFPIYTSLIMKMIECPRFPCHTAMSQNNNIP